MSLVLAAVLLVPGALGLSNGLAALPPMGWSSWYAAGSWVSEEVVKTNAEFLLSSGLAAKGYRYVNVDEGWLLGRDNQTSMLYEDRTRFPSGMQGLGAWLHGKGLRYGLYTSRGTCQCTTPEYDHRCVPTARSAPHPEGSNGFESHDAKFFAAAAADFVKVDSCCGSQDHATAFADYARFRDALNATGRPMVHSLCGWFPWYAPVGAGLGNTWRISADGDGWHSHLVAVDTMAALTQWTGPGGWNDPDFLIGRDCAVCTEPPTHAQVRAQMSLWAVFPAPLLISAPLHTTDPYTVETWGNAEVIAVNQDAAARAGVRLAGGNLSGAATPAQRTNVWGKALADGAWALVLVNAAAEPRRVACAYADCLWRTGFPSGTTITVRDLWAHTSNGTVMAADGLSFVVPGGGGCVMLRLTPHFE